MPFPLSETDDGFIESHFKRRQFRWDEDYFLSMLEHPRSKHDVYWAAIALRKVGTEKSIEPLRALLTFPMQDVKCVAILTIAHVARERATPILSQALLDPVYREKVYAMWAINDAADERAVPAVLEYFAKNKSKMLKGQLTNGTFVDGVEFLSKHAENHPEVQAFLNRIPTFWKKLLIGERTELQKRLPELAKLFEDISI
jgi:PBS lyase HEAT-like repeat-containing protein